MTLILMAGDWQSKSEHLHHLLAAGYLLGSSAQATEAPHTAQAMPPIGLVAMVNCQADVDAAAAVAGSLRLPWVAWDCRGGMWTAARHSGAIAALTNDSTPDDLVETVALFPTQTEISEHQPVEPEIRSFRTSEVVTVDSDSVVEIRSGVLAMRTAHPGGSELLMGLVGPGGIITGHPTYAGRVALVAHSDAEVSVRPWRDVATTWQYAVRSRQLQSYLASWYSVQSWTRVEQRVLGILILLAERFGRPTRPARSGWETIDVRLTHQHLADAICASRPTVSKAVQELLSTEVIRSNGAADYRRIHINTDLAREMATR